MSGTPVPKLSRFLPDLRRLLRRLAPHLAPQRPLIGGAIVSLIVATGLRLLEPWPLKFVIDRLVGAERPGRGWDLLDGLSTTTLIPLCALALVAIVALKAGAEYLSTVGFTLVGNRVVTAVRETLFQHLQRLSLSFHARRRTGELTLRLLGDVGMLREAAVTAALPLAASAAVLVGMVAIMLWLDWRLALVALAPLPLLWVGSQRITRRIREASRGQRQRESSMAASATEYLAAVRTVQALSLEPYASGVFGGANRKSLSDGVRAGRLGAALERLVDVASAGATALVLWFGAQQVLRDALTPGELLVFITYFKNSMRPARDYAKFAARLAKASAAGERVVDLLDEKPANVDAPGTRPAPRLDGALRFDAVSFAYAADAPRVLDRIDLEIRAGERLAIIGESGSGKSTIASLLLRLYDPVEGCITVDGQDLREFTLQSLRRRIDIVPQETLLFATTVHENIAMAAGREVTRDQVVAAARLANAHDFITRLPQAYDTLVGERGATLSNGQRQRIAIARAALRDGDLLILDEVTVGLDAENTAIVNDALERLSRGRTTVVITHDLILAARADRIVHLERGRIVEAGDHDGLMTLDGRYANWWRMSQPRSMSAP
ncbi:MAG: ABC transporter ATP-binding protein [Burkholderiaceae bacterium]